jgi:inosine/xanthosine triphosphatase
MKIVVTSKNPVKISAAEQGVHRMFPDVTLEVTGASASSGVADQPMSEKETRQGALNRINHVLTLMPDADLYVSMEGGIEDRPDAHGVMQMVCFAWVVVRDKNGKWGESRSADLTLPFAVADLVRQGLELGEADDRVFGRSNSKQQNGAVGLLTKDAITRAAYYEMPVVLALIPIVNSDLYK